jgi:hypothetical protein
MMPSDGRLRRFLHLERARPDGPTAQPARDLPDGTEERISGVEQPAATPVGAKRTRTGARLERFGPEPEPRLELLEVEGRRPFIRCHRCGTDSNVFATECQGCGSSLDTPEQHEFDERFWTARQAEDQQEARQAVDRRELQARAEEEDARARRAMGEAIAREVGESERRRIDSWTGGGGSRREWSPLGLRLVRRLVPDERWHAAALSVAAGLAAALAGYGVHARSVALGAAGAVALVLLLVNSPE